MHPRLLELYNEELGYVREMGTEFARQFPKIAGRLALDSTEVADPYVERLFEGFAFLAARVQLKIEAEFPRFVQHLMEVTYPGLIAPVPSMAIARLQPDPAESNLASGVVVPRGAALQSVHVRGAQTRCQFRTAHDVTLWPLQVASVEYFSFAPDLPLTQLPQLPQFSQLSQLSQLSAGAPGANPVVRGGLRIRLRGFDGVKLRDLPLDRLTFFLSAPDHPAFRLHELVFASALGAMVLPVEQPVPWFEWSGPESIHAIGFAEDEALPPAR